MSSVQKAIYQALSDALDMPVFDYVKQDQAYPYTVIDAVDGSPDDYMTGGTQKCFVYLSIWSRYKGKAEVSDAIEAIRTLHQKRFAMESGNMISCRVTRWRINRDADAVTYQGTVTLEVWTE